MTVDNLLDLYTDYLLVSPTYITATGLSRVTGNEISHDKVTRLLSWFIDSKTLWSQVKLMVHERTSREGVLIIDDSVELKPYAKSNLFINWHYDHNEGKCVKEVNFVTSFYYSPEHDMGLPVGMEFVIKNSLQFQPNRCVTSENY